MGTPKAMTATAHKLARIVYYMITTQQEYDALFSTARAAQAASEGSKTSRPGKGTWVPSGSVGFSSLGEPGELPFG